MNQRFPRLTLIERLEVAVLNTIPSLARGVATTRPGTVRVFDRLQVDRRMVALLDRLRQRYRGSPVWMDSPRGPALLLLSPRHVERVLGGSDRLYTLDTRAKRRAFGIFEPHAVVISRGEVRARRRAFNESILDSRSDQPRTAEHDARVVSQEIASLVSGPGRDGILHWPEIQRAFGCVSRRVVFGDAARDDVDTTQLLRRLLREANTFGLKPGGRQRAARWKAEWERRLERYAASAPADSLIGRLADTSGSADIDPYGQVAHWCLSLDMVAVVAARALALLASHPEHFSRANEELIAADAHHDPGSAASVAAQPYLEACVLEAARLWPLVPNLVRSTTRAVEWDGVMVKSNTTLVISALHQARSRHLGRRGARFIPEQWLDGSLDNDWTMLPFSAGPAACPGEMLATFLATAACAEVLRRSYVRTASPALAPDMPLPYSLPAASINLAVGVKPNIAAPSPMAVAGGSSSGETL
ncbi:MAG TPA: cytochrome P450 [Stackebrandtia sp.]|uniref:cytochrome P450 n=1 Tax=Stackebrandtia sp. TaxID=2023065 RepID=UPI002D64F082|nr:cytochrome P450 [Stackebrandtia sp.]HZE41438.1 cytochrome P450 [Stackebrandtia sp.]